MPEWKEKFMEVSTLFSNLFPLWTVLGAGTALLRPATFDFMTTSSFTAGLSILMFSMGITMTLDDFKRVFSKVRAGPHKLARSSSLRSVWRLPPRAHARPRELTH